MALALGNWSALASKRGMDDTEFARERRHELLSVLAGLLTTACSRQKDCSCSVPAK